MLSCTTDYHIISNSHNLTATRLHVDIRYRIHPHKYARKQFLYGKTEQKSMIRVKMSIWHNNIVRVRRILIINLASLYIVEPMVFSTSGRQNYEKF